MSYLTDIRSALMSRLPEPFVTAARRRMIVYRGRRARALLAKPPEGPSVLSIDELRALQAAYPSPPSYGYSPDKRKRRGEMRAATLNDLSAEPTGQRSLEIGCMDGMASAALQNRGWQATALDLSSKDFDPRARTSGVRLLEMDAAQLQLPDDSFDLSFSYNAFEHIEEVEAAFAELVRVTKPGGMIYLDFGPLYNSAAGLHAYRSVRVPYCQFLFDRATLDTFCREIDCPPIRYEQVNGRPLKDYRTLWSRHLTSEAVELVSYEERWNGQGIPLIERYTSCFSSKDLNFDELIVQSIRTCFRVRKGRTVSP